MFERFFELLKFNQYLFNKQSTVIFFLILFFLGFKFFIHNINFNDNHSVSELQVSLSNDNIEKLITVPYIGEKTAIKIIELKFRNGKIIKEDLKEFRNYKKFQYYIKE